MCLNRIADIAAMVAFSPKTHSPVPPGGHFPASWESFPYLASFGILRGRLTGRARVGNGQLRALNPQSPSNGEQSRNNCRADGCNRELQLTQWAEQTGQAVHARPQGDVRTT